MTTVPDAQCIYFINKFCYFDRRRYEDQCKKSIYLFVTCVYSMLYIGERKFLGTPHSSFRTEYLCMTAVLVLRILDGRKVTTTLTTFRQNESIIDPYSHTFWPPSGLLIRDHQCTFFPNTVLSVTGPAVTCCDPAKQERPKAWMSGATAQM